MTRSFVLPPPPPLVSPPAMSVATATLGLVLFVATWRPPAPLIRDHVNRDREDVRFLLPLRPSHTPIPETTLLWRPDRFANGLWGTGQQLVGALQRAAASSGAARRGPVTHRHTQRANHEVGPDTTKGTVYIESELDRPVERDPLSGGPVYPKWLEDNHIEGSVTASFIVDSTGLADSVSLHIRSATNPAFADAVRAAMTVMRFRPAELNGRHVRQLVMQEFRFVIAPSTPLTPHPGLPSAPAPSDSHL